MLKHAIAARQKMIACDELHFTTVPRHNGANMTSDSGQRTDIGYFLTVAFPKGFLSV